MTDHESTKRKKEDMLESVVLPHATLSRLLQTKDPAGAIALYAFYCYTAKWQQTNQPKCTTNYTAKGLKITEDKVRKLKTTLKELKLVEDIKQKEDSGKVVGWFIKLPYLIKEKNHPTKKPQGGKNHRVEKPPEWKNHTVENQGTNALSINSINALSINKKVFNKLNTGDLKIAGKNDKIYLKNKRRYNNILSETLIKKGGFKTRINNKSDVMVSVYKFLDQLEHGLFFKNKTLESPLLDNMDTSRINKVLTITELTKVLLKASVRWKKLMASDDKFKPKKQPSLDSWFYSPPPYSDHGMSWFLYVATNSIKDNKAIVQGKQLEGILKYLSVTVDKEAVNQRFYGSSTPPFKDGQLLAYYSNIKALIQWRKDYHESLMDRGLHKANEHQGFFTNLYNNSIMFEKIHFFLQDTSEGRWEGSPTFLVPNGYRWEQFKKWMADSFSQMQIIDLK